MVRTQRQSVGHTQGAHQPDRLQVSNHQSRISRGQFPDCLVPHRLAEFVFQLTPPSVELFLELLLLLIQLCRRLGRDVDMIVQALPNLFANCGGIRFQPMITNLGDLSDLPGPGLPGVTGQFWIMPVRVLQRSLGGGGLQVKHR